MSQTKWQLFFVIVVSLLSYITIFDNELIGDDRDFIENWTTIQQTSAIPKLLAGDVPESHMGVYRPVRGVLYFFTYQIWGENVFGYHLHSVITHTFVSLLLYWVILKLSPQNKTVAFLTSLLFASHPIHTEAVSFITASFDTTAFVFMMASFGFYLNFRKSKLGRDLKISTLLYLLAMGTNEVTYVYPIILGIYHLLFDKVAVKKYFELTKQIWLVFGGMFLLRFGVLHITTRSQYAGGSFWLAQLISLKAVLWYLYLTFLPVKLGLIHILPGNISTYMFQDLNVEVIRQQSLFEPSIFIVVSILSILFVTAWKVSKSNPLISFGIIWYLISLVPVLNLLPTAVYFSERYSYLATVGFCLVVGYLLTNLIGSQRTLIKSLGYLVTTIILVAYIALSLYHNQFWQDELVYWEKNVKENPENFLAQYQLAQIYHSRFYLEKAITHYKKSIELEPNYARTHNNLGLIYQHLHQYDLAISEYDAVLRKYPDSEVALANKSLSQLSWAKNLIHQEQYPQAEDLLVQSQQNPQTSLEASQTLKELCALINYTCQKN